jgi:hypothetical protein
MTALLEERPSTLMSAPCHGVAEGKDGSLEAKTQGQRPLLKARRAAPLCFPV